LKKLKMPRSPKHRSPRRRPRERKPPQSSSEESDSGSEDDSEPWLRSVHLKRVTGMHKIAADQPGSPGNTYLATMDGAGKQELYLFYDHGPGGSTMHPFDTGQNVFSVHTEHIEVMDEERIGFKTEFWTIIENEETDGWEIWHYYDIVKNTGKKKKKRPFRWQKKKVAEFPEACDGNAEIFVRSGVCYAACFLKPGEGEDCAIECYPPDDNDKQLQFFDGKKWKLIGLVPTTSDDLNFWVDADVVPRFAFVRRCDYIYTEANPGELCVARPVEDSKKDLCWTEVTKDAGRLENVQFSPNGDVIMFAANFPPKNKENDTLMAITTHSKLWLLPWDEQLPGSPKPGDPGHILLSAQNITPDFDLLPESEKTDAKYLTSNLIFFNVIRGPIMKSVILRLKQCSIMDTRFINGKPEVVELAHIATCPPIVKKDGTMVLFASESIDSYGEIRKGNGDRILFTIPQMEEFKDLEAEVVEWKAQDGTQLHGLYYRNADVDYDDCSGLVVWVHGGPFSTIPPLRQGLCDYCDEVPFKALLLEGFAVFAPIYRGSAGSGNEFARANIGRHGHKEADLGDIISGVEMLKERHGFDRVGVFGHSYGGYLSLKAVETAPEIFRCAVSLYGYMHKRWGCLETGDFTWEQEYFGTTEQSFKEQIFGGKVVDDVDVRNINCPVMFLSGNEDDVCPPSQARVAFHFMHRRGVKVKLVVYEGEGHGFEDPDVLEDRDERIVDWFSEHMIPPEEESSEEESSEEEVLTTANEHGQSP